MAQPTHRGIVLSIIAHQLNDFQTHPKELPKLLIELKTKDLDLVYGVYSEKKHAGWRNLGSRLVNRFFQAIFKTKIRVSSYRVIRRSLLNCILSYDTNFTYLDGLFAWNSQRIGNVVVDHFPRENGKSGYSVAKLVTLALNMLCNFSIWPLQAIFFVGILLALPSFGVALFYCYRYIVGDIVVPGYASSILSILILGGIQLLGIGLLGQYLGRLFLTTNQKPQYTERVVHQLEEDRAAPPLERVWS